MYIQRFIAFIFLSIVCLTAAGTTYYSQASADATILTNWNDARNGAGAAPGNFSSGDIFVIQGSGNGGTTPHSMTTSAAWTVSGAGSTIQIENGATLTATFIVAVPNFQVDNGGFYIHNAVSGSSNGVATDIPGSTTRIFGASSTVEIQKWANGGASPVALPTLTAPGWGNLTINVASLVGSWNQSGTLTAIQGNFNIQATGGGAFEFRLTGNTVNTTTVGGNFSITGGAFKQSQGTGNSTMNVTGNFSIGTGVTVTPQNSSGPTVTFGITGNFTNNGTVTSPGSGHIVVWTIGGNALISNGSFGLSSSSSSSLTVTVTGSLTISGTSTVSSTSSGNWTITTSGDFNFSGTTFQSQNSSSSSHFYALNVGGNFNMTGGTFTGSSTANPQPLTITFTGGTTNVTYTQSAGTITSGRQISWVIASGKVVLLNNDIPVQLNGSNPGSFTINSGGTLDCKTNNVTGTGSFTVANGGYLRIGSAAGITSSGATGSVQCTGTRTYNTGSHYEYNGTAAQVTGTGLPSQVKTLSANNTAYQSITLTNTVNVDDSLGLQNGFFTTSTSAIINMRDTTVIGSSNSNYNTCCSITNIGWERSFVKGPLRIDISTTTAKWLPVGKIAGTDTLFAPVKITKNNATAVGDTVEYFATPYVDTAADAGQIRRISYIEYWKISGNTATAADVDSKVTLSWRPKSQVGDGAPVNDATALNDLIVTHYIDGDAGGPIPFLWRIDGGDVAAMPKATGSTVNYGTVTTNLNNATHWVTYTTPFFTLGSKSFYNLLPLKLIQFTGTATGNTIKLNWVTKDEQQVKNFEVQKSTDGIHFATIATVAASNSQGINDYTALDDKPFAGINYYRLKVKDLAQKVAYTVVIKVMYSKNAALSIYPNPVKGECTITHDKVVNQAVIKIISASGVELLAQKVLPGQWQSHINLSNYAAGSYIIKFIEGNQVTTKTFYKL